jgi:hypothetical protein
MEYQMRRTQYNDPEQKSGQHTNGPANIFVRQDDTSPWYSVERQMPAHKVRNLIEELGFMDFTHRHCARVCD